MSVKDFYFEFNNTTDLLQNFALKLTRDMDRARDLYQETAYRAFKYKDKFQIGTNFKAWAVTLMKNIFINDFRKQRRRKVNAVASDDPVIINGSSVTDNAGESELLRQEIMQAIASIDQKYAAPFLQYYRGFSYQEVADQQQIPLGTLKSHIHTARKLLKDKLQDSYNNTF